MRRQELDRIAAALQRKADKIYPEGTALVVMFYDFKCAWEREHIKALRAWIEPRLETLTSIQWLAVIGWSRQVYEEFDLSR